MFKHYAEYYDAIYSDKDYQKEILNLKKIFEKMNGKFHLGNLLELGCGTGGHALHLCPFYENYTGVDLSGEMIEQFAMKLYPSHFAFQANRCGYTTRNTEFSVTENSNVMSIKDKNREVSFHILNLAKDSLELNISTSFDTCISLFHVFSYMTNDNDVQNYLKNAARYLKKDGLFIFDYWNKTGVKHLGLESRKKEFLISAGKIVREVTPLSKGRENQADIMIDVKVFDHQGKMIETFLEKHPMRFFYKDEIEIFLSEAGFKIEMICGEDKIEGNVAPEESDWAGIVVARKILCPL